MATKYQGAPKAPPIGVRFPKDTKRWLEMFSSENHRSMNSVVIEAVRRFRAQQEVQHG